MSRKTPVRPEAAVLAALAAHGLLQKQDKQLPNVVSILTGESLCTSWWSHPQSHRIFAVLEHLAGHDDVLLVKLLAGKDTFVHRMLWPSVLAVGSARQSWQVQGLSRAGKRLLERLDAGESVRAAGAPVKELLGRLLATAREVHTASGRHAMELETWQAWSLRVGCRALPSVARGREDLEQAAVAFGAALDSLPWHRHAD